MGVRKGSVSYSLFHVEGDLPPDAPSFLLERAREFALQELTPDSEQDQHIGWCALDDLLTLDFTPDHLFRGEYVCLGMRIDRWSLPGALLKARIARAEDAHRQHVGRLRLSRHERDQIRTQEILSLKKLLIPTAASIDVVWSLPRREVRLWTQSPTRVEAFQQLFESTFQLRPWQHNAWLAATTAGLSPEEVAATATLAITPFAARS
jgi:recombination associated protein RdgC